MTSPENRPGDGIRFELAFKALKAYDLKRTNSDNFASREDDGLVMGVLRESIGSIYNSRYSDKDILVMSLLPDWSLRKIMTISPAVADSFNSRSNS